MCNSKGNYHNDIKVFKSCQLHAFLQVNEGLQKKKEKKNLPVNMVFSLFFHPLLSNKAFMGNEENT